jgi:hypothetical protein
MLDTFGFPTPQQSNYQEFYGGATSSNFRSWTKPRGASMVRMLLIGAGAGGRAGTTGTGGAGGGSGAVTEWIGPAIFIPDQLRIYIGNGGVSAQAGGNTIVAWQGPTSSAGYNLLTANGAASNTAGTASTNNFFGASGIFKSTGGQNGASAGVAITASTTTFLSGGAGGSTTTTNVGSAVACNYGYTAISGGVDTTGGTGGSGFFFTQPIMIGVGGAGGGGNATLVGGTGGQGGIGCGGGGGGIGTTAGGAGGRGGDGAVFIWSW